MSARYADAVVGVAVADVVVAAGGDVGAAAGAIAAGIAAAAVDGAAAAAIIAAAGAAAAANWRCRACCSGRPTGMGQPLGQRHCRETGQRDGGGAGDVAGRTGWQQSRPGGVAAAAAWYRGPNLRRLVLSADAPNRRGLTWEEVSRMDICRK